MPGLLVSTPASPEDHPVPNDLVALLMLPWEIRIWEQIQVLVGKEICEYPMGAPWHLGNAPVIRLSADSFRTHFGPKTFESSILRFIRSGVLCMVAPNEYRLEMQPKNFVSVPIKARYIALTHKQEMMWVKKLRDKFKQPKAGETRVLNRWFDENMPGRGTSTRMHAVYVGLREDDDVGAAGFALLIRHGSSYALARDGLCRFDFVPNPNEEMMRMKFEVIPPPEDALNWKGPAEEAPAQPVPDERPLKSDDASRQELRTAVDELELVLDKRLALAREHFIPSSPEVEAMMGKLDQALVSRTTRKRELLEELRLVGEAEIAIKGRLLTLIAKSDLARAAQAELEAAMKDEAV
ncbi:hypothetical protein KBA73_02280 [Patescibacteria group bacterium]|nr:hypothetical protein [Patescibacteria group bacterium]